MPNSGTQAACREQDDRALSPSLWAEYQAERLGIEALEYDWGFVLYRFDNETGFVVDFFVTKEMRDRKHSKQLIHEFIDIARNRGAIQIIGEVSLKFPDAQRRVRFWHRLGADILSANNDILLFILRI